MYLGSGLVEDEVVIFSLDKKHWSKDRYKAEIMR